MDLNDLQKKAKGLFEQRGGADAAKKDAEELKDIASGEQQWNGFALNGRRVLVAERGD